MAKKKMQIMFDGFPDKNLDSAMALNRDDKLFAKIYREPYDVKSKTIDGHHHHFADYLFSFHFFYQLYVDGTNTPWLKNPFETVNVYFDHSKLKYVPKKAVVVHNPQRSPKDSFYDRNDMLSTNEEHAKHMIWGFFRDNAYRQSTWYRDVELTRLYRDKRYYKKQLKAIDNKIESYVTDMNVL